MSAPEEVEAEIVEPVNLAKAPEPAIEYTLPTATIGNLDAIEEYVADMEAFFSGVQIDVTDSEQVKQLKGVRADINKVARAIDDGRKAMDRDVKSAIGDADRVLNGLRDRVRAVYDATGKQIEEADALQKQARLNVLAREYEAAAPDLMALIPLDAFIAREPKLAQKSWSGTKACDALADMVVSAVRERDNLKASDLEFHDQADMAYCKTLDLSAALAENQRLVDERERSEAHKQEATRLDAAIGKAHEAVSAAKPPQPEPAHEEPPQAPQEAPENPKRYLYSLEFEAGGEAGGMLKGFMRTIPGLEGKSFKRKEVAL